MTHTEVFEKVKRLLSDQQDIMPSKITLAFSLLDNDERIVDEIGYIELWLSCEQAFGVQLPVDAREQCPTVGDFVNSICDSLKYSVKR